MLTSDIGVLERLPETEPLARIRAFLPCIASQVETKKFTEERQPLSLVDVSRLSDTEIEIIADAYSTAVLRGSSVEAAEKLLRQSNEDATTYLNRLLKHEVEDHVHQQRKMRDKMLSSTSSLFDQVRKSATTLGSTLSAFEQLKKEKKPVEIHAPNMNYLHAMNEHFARQARERAEELEMVRLTGKMTAESAKTLKDLAEAATVLLEQLDERDKKADKSTRHQITITVWSVGVSAVLALLALIVSGLAYYQDKINNESGDRWQSELISAVRDGRQQRVMAEKENQLLRDQVAALEAKIVRIESAQATVLLDKSAASAARRPTNPGRTFPAP